MNNRPTLIFIPTFNEADNVERVCRQLTLLELDADILFCDDNSPDGTGEIIDRFAAELPHVHALHRPARLGIGSAHQEGIRYAYEAGYGTLLTMDCDFNHQPADARRLLEEAGEHPVTVASSQVRPGSLATRNLSRRVLGRLSHFLTVNLLRLPQDATGTLRVYKLDRIPLEVFDLVKSAGYAFFFESLFILHRNDFPIHEVPIQPSARTSGRSKLTLKETWRSATGFLQVWIANLTDPKQFLLWPRIESAPLPLPTRLVWDSYWSRGRATMHGICASIASACGRRAWSATPAHR